MNLSKIPDLGQGTLMVPNLTLQRVMSGKHLIVRGIAQFNFLLVLFPWAHKHSCILMEQLDPHTCRWSQQGRGSPGDLYEASDMERGHLE